MIKLSAFNQRSTLKNNFYRQTKLRTYQINRKLGTPDPVIKAYDDYQFIFVHIPKTGGTSIRKLFFKKSFFPPHLTLTDYNFLFGKKTLDRYFKFAIVRNPWDRIVSAYSYLKSGAGGGKVGKIWAKHIHDNNLSFDTFIKGLSNRKTLYSHILLVPQYEFLNIQHKTLGIDYIGKFEQLNDSFSHVQNHLGLNMLLPHLNKSHRKTSYQAYYTPEIVSLVADLYQTDIKLFDYSF